MVLLQDARAEFYLQLRGMRCTVFVMTEIDAICSWIVLRHLFHCENIMYSMFPVKNCADVEKAFQEYTNPGCPVILINCSGNVDMMETYNLDENANVFLIDSMRPFHVHNVFNSGQIKIVVHPGDLAEEDRCVPAFEDLFQDDSDNETTQNTQSQEPNIPIMGRKDNKERWEQNREQALKGYYKNTYYRCPSAVVLFDLAWKSAKDNVTLLWAAMVSVSYMHLSGKITRNTYIRIVTELQTHASRLSLGQSSRETSVMCVQVTFIEDLNCPLLRQWSIWQSCHASIDIYCLFKLWSVKGRNRFSEFLADMGISIQDAKRTYNALDSNVQQRLNVEADDERLKNKYRYDERSMRIPTFLVSYGHQTTCSAVDFASAVLAIMVIDDVGKLRSKDQFTEVLRCFNWPDRQYLNTAIEYGKQLLTTIIGETQSLLETQRLVSYGRFICVPFDIKEHPKEAVWKNPITLQILSLYLLNAHRSGTLSRKAKMLPMILNVQLSEHQAMIVGTPAFASNCCNYFSSVFEEAVEASAIEAEFCSFDKTVVRMKPSDCALFLTSMNRLLPSSGSKL